MPPPPSSASPIAPARPHLAVRTSTQGATAGLSSSARATQQNAGYRRSPTPGRMRSKGAGSVSARRSSAVSVHELRWPSLRAAFLMRCKVGTHFTSFARRVQSVGGQSNPETHAAPRLPAVRRQIQDSERPPPASRHLPSISIQMPRSLQPHRPLWDQPGRKPTAPVDLDGPLPRPTATAVCKWLATETEFLPETSLPAPVPR